MTDGEGPRASAFGEALSGSDGLAGWLRREAQALAAERAWLWLVAPCGARHVFVAPDAVDAVADGPGSGERAEVEAARPLVSGMVAHLRLGWARAAEVPHEAAADLLARLEDPVSALIARSEGYRHALVNSPLERRRRIFSTATDWSSGSASPPPCGSGNRMPCGSSTTG